MITGPGIYDIEIGAYHHDPNLCDGPSISASGLKAVADCPARYWAFSPYNKDRYIDETTKAFDIGKAAHALVLGEPEFAKYFVVSPYDAFNKKPGYIWYNDEWKPSVESGREARTLLKPDDFKTVKLMAQAQRASQVVMMAFEYGKPEQSLIAKDAETGVWLKSRPDWLPDDPTMRFISDYKSCVTIEPRKLSNDAFKYGYHIQAAMQFDLVQAVMGVRPLGVAHVVQEKDPPYLADLRMFQPEALDYGRLIYRKALRTFSDCMARGKWPAYTDVPQYFETPPWVARQMEEFDGNDGHYDTNEPAYTGADYFAAG